MELRSSDGTILSPDIPVWLDRSSCNLEHTFVWIKIPLLDGGQTLRLRLIFGSGIAKTIPTMNTPKNVFEIFDNLKVSNTVLFQHNPNIPTNYTDKGLEVQATSTLLESANTRRTSRFAQPISRPYVIETVGALSDCSSHMLYAADTTLATPATANFAFDWRCSEKSSSSTHSMALCTTIPSSGSTVPVRRMSMAVSQGINATVKALDNTCSPLQISNITDKTKDYVYFGSNVSTADSRYEWIAVRKYVEIEPIVTIGGVLQQVTEFVCEFPSFTTAAVADEEGHFNKNNLTLYQTGHTLPEWNEEKNTLFVERYTEIELDATNPNTVSIANTLPIELQFATKTLVKDMAIAVVYNFRGDTETILMTNCSIPNGALKGHCIPPPFYGVDKGFPPQEPVTVPILVSSNKQQFVDRGDTISYSTVGKCAVIGLESFEDDLPNFQFGLAEVSSQGKKDTACGAFDGTKALMFKSTTAGERYARSVHFDARCGMDIEFYLKIGNYDGCTTSTRDQVVELQYSTDEGATWFQLSEDSVYKDRDYSAWTKVTPTFPKEAKTRRTILRWHSDPTVSGSAPIDHIIWALDLVKVEARLCSSAEELIFAGSNVVPASGPVTGGTLVTIQGDFTEAVGKAVQCKFGELIAADITLVTATAITCVSPQQNQEGYVSIALSICGSLETEPTTQFYYYNPPAIQLYSPESMPTSGGRVRFVLQSDFAWFSTTEVKVEFLHTPSSFSTTTSGNLVAVDELLAEQPRGSSYRDQGFPWSTSAEIVRFQTVYKWLQLKAAGLNAGDEITQISVLPAECPTLDVTEFRISIAMREGDPIDGLPVNFADGLYMNDDPPKTVLGTLAPATISASTCVPNQWMALTLDTPFTLEEGKALLVEFSEENNIDTLLTGKNIPLGLTMRHTFTSQTIRWHGALTLPGEWPYTGSSLVINDNVQLDQRLPCLKLCKSSGCPAIVTVIAVMTDFSANIDPAAEMNGFEVGIALNGQQSNNFPLAVYRPMYSLLNMQPPLGPSVGGSSIRIVPADFSSGDTTVVAIFTQAGNPSELANDPVAEISVVKYYTACTSAVVNENTVFDCIATPKAPPGEYQVYVALNAVSFDAQGVSFYYYPPMSVIAIAPFTGVASGGEKIIVSGSGFFGEYDLIYCRFGRACFTGENDCVADSNQAGSILPVEEGVTVRTKAVFIDANTIECESPARPLGTWEIFVSNNGQDFEPDEALGGLVSYTSRPCGEGREAFEYYDACVQCDAGFFDSDAERPNRVGEATDTVYPIQCAQCPIGQFQEEKGQLLCNECPVGTTTLATVDNRIVQIAAASSRTNDCTCLNKDLSVDGISSFYQDKLTTIEEAGGTGTWLTDGSCTPCPEGAVCDGGNATIYADDGYWQQLKLNGDSLEVFQKCTPASACKKCDLECMEQKKICTRKGATNGGRGLLNASYPTCQLECFCDDFNCYVGDGCATCGRDVPIPDGTPAQNFYREDGYCERCPPTDGAILIFMIIGAIVGLYFFALFAQYFRGLGAPRIWVNFMAVTIAFAKFDLNWPPEVIAFFRWFSQFYIDIDVVKPECEISLTFFESWIYMMIIPIFVLSVLVTWYAITSVSSKPFGSAKERARLSDKDRRATWLKFTKWSDAWALVQLMREKQCKIEVFDELDDVVWVLDPTDSVVYGGSNKKSIRLWKKQTEELAKPTAKNQLWRKKSARFIKKQPKTLSIIKYHLKRTPIARERLIAVESCRVNSQDVVKRPLYDANILIPGKLLNGDPSKNKNQLSSALKADVTVPVYRVTRRVRSRAVKIAGVDLNSATVASRGKLLVSIGTDGKVEYSRGFAWLFKLDDDVASRSKEFMIDKIKFDIDGPVSTANCKAYLKLRVTIFRSKNGEPDWDGEPLADGKIKIKNPGVVAVDFSGAVAVSHYWHPTYWLVVKPVAGHLVGSDAKSGQWVLRHVRDGVTAPTQFMNCTLGAGAVDAIDMGAYTKTSFVPLQKGVRIEGKSAWGEWTHNRCEECEAIHDANKDNPDKWNDIITCTHQIPFAFSISCVYPDDMDYVAAGDITEQQKKSTKLRNLRKHRSVSDMSGKSMDGEEDDNSDEDSAGDNSDDDIEANDELDVQHDDDNDGKEEEEEEGKGMEEKSNEKDKENESTTSDRFQKPGTPSFDAKSAHAMERLQEDGGKLGVLLSEATVHLGFKNKGSVFATKLKRTKRMCAIDCKHREEKCKANRCGRAVAEPFIFLWTFFSLIYYNVVLIFWSALMLVGFVLWIVVTLLQSLHAGLKLAYRGKEMLYLYCHSKMCPCCRRWQTSFIGFVVTVVVGIVWVFLGDLALQWGMELEDGTPGVLPRPYSRLHFLSLLFVVATFLLVVEMTPRRLYDMESISAGNAQLISFEKRVKRDKVILKGTVIMQMGPAILVKMFQKNAKCYSMVIHRRQVLETGLTPEQELATDQEDKMKSLDKHNNNAAVAIKREPKLELETTSGKVSLTLDPASREQWVHWSHERQNAGVQDIVDVKLKEGLLLFQTADGSFQEHYFVLRSARLDKPAELEWSTDTDVHNMDAALCIDKSTTVSTESVELPVDSKESDKNISLFEINSKKSQKIIVLGAKSIDLRWQWIEAIRQAKLGQNVSTPAVSSKVIDLNVKPLQKPTQGQANKKKVTFGTGTTKKQNEQPTHEHVHVRRNLSRWTWYDSVFGPHLLRYVLTTKDLNEFDAQRNSIHQVKEMHKIHELRGIEHEVPWDMKNSYINAFFLFILFVHLTLTKNIVGVFICTKQPHSGELTLDEHPEMICWTSSEHQYVLAFAQFFLMIYTFGIPLFVVYKLREIFRAEREFDPKIRARYGYLYFKYTHDSYLWEIVIIARKSFIALVRMFTKTPAYFLIQSSGALIVLSVLLVMQILWAPYNEPFLNHMETAALTNHVFVLFIGIMFQSGALDVAPGEGNTSVLNSYTFAMILIISIFATWLYLLTGIAKELSEMGLVSMASQGAASMVMENYGKSVQKVRRTARGHWCFRWMGNCCARKVAERGSVNDDDASLLKKKMSFASQMKEMKERLSKKTAMEESKDGAQKNKKTNKKKKVYQAPAPPRYPPPALHYNDWHCPACNFFNDEKEHPYARTCAQCSKRRPQKKAKLKVSLAQKKRSLGLEIDLLNNVLLSEDAQFAAVNWGIEDHSTTLRETYWLVKALRELVHSILEVYFNIRQISKQQEEQSKFAAIQKSSLYFTKPFLHVYRACCAKKAQAKIDQLVEARGWVRRVDPMSKMSYYIHVDKTHGHSAGGEFVELSEPGWYSFFDCDRYRLYYGHLGSKGWEHTTWHTPHESDVVINGSAGKVVTAVSWKKPKSPDAFVQIKIDRLVERLTDLDVVMKRVQQIVGPKISLPHFDTFKEFIAGLLGVPIHGLIATHINKGKNEDKLDDRASRHASRLFLSTPAEPIDLGGRQLSSIQVDMEDEQDVDDEKESLVDVDVQLAATKQREEAVRNRAVRKRRASKHQQHVHTGNVVEGKGEEFKSSSQLQEMQQKNSAVEATAADMNHIFDGLDTFGLETKGIEEEKGEQPPVSDKETQDKNIERKSTMQILFPASNEKKEEQPTVEKQEKETQDKNIERKSTMQILLTASNEEKEEQPTVEKSKTSKIDKCKPKLRAYLLKHQSEWKEWQKQNDSDKIPPSMKKFFKKQKLGKDLAREILRE